MNPLLWISPLAFLAVALAVWAVGRRWLRVPAWLAAWESRRTKRDDRDAPARFSQPLRRILEARVFRPLVRPKTELDRRRLQRELAQAGFNFPLAVETYLFLRLAIPAAAAALTAGVHLGWAGPSCRGLLVPAAVAGAAFLAVPAGVRWRQRRRQRDIRNTLPESLDLMAMAVECGQGVDVAMQQAADDLAESAPTLAGEFQTCQAQLNLGCDRRDALHDFALRCGTPEALALANTLIQSHRFGSSISQALRDQSRHMRALRRHRAEESARKAAFLLIFPLVLFIFPAVFVSLVGPAAISILRDLAAMQ